MTEEIIKQSWEEQFWDTQKSFETFRKYYLPQKAPKSLTRAYHDYLRDQGKTDKFIQGRKAPGTWQKWYRGQDSDGKPIKGAMSWKQRGEAYDSFLEETREEIKLERKMSIVDREIKDHDQQLDIWQGMVNDLEAKLDQERNFSIDPTGFDPRPFIKPFDDLVKVREKIAVFGRRSVGLPTSINEDRIANADNGEFKVVWEEPKFGEGNIGIGAEIVENAIKKRIETKNAKHNEKQSEEWEEDF